MIPAFVSAPLEQFGIATYGVYLLHPIVNLYLNFVLHKFGVTNPMIHFVLVMVLTVAMAITSYNFIEKRLMGVGKRITSADGGYLGFLRK